MHDAIQDPWGPATPIGRGDDWPERVDVHLADGVAADDVERWVQSASLLHSNGDAMDIAVSDGRIVGVRGRASDRVNHGRLGPKDLFGWQANASPERLTHPARRPPGQLGGRRWARRSALPRAARGARSLGDRLLHDRAAVLRGVLHAGRDRAGRDRHQPSGRQHPAVHRDRRRGAEGVLRLRRPARLLRRRHPLRRARALGPQHRRDPDRAVDAHARPPRRTRPASHACRRPAPNGPGPCRRRASGAAARHQPRR